jgi:hypothetical protein
MPEPETMRLYSQTVTLHLHYMASAERAASSGWSWRSVLGMPRTGPESVQVVGFTDPRLIDVGPCPDHDYRDPVVIDDE